MDFQIPVLVKNKRCFRIVIEEGASMCIMSLNCWKSLGSPTPNQSSTILKDFDGRGFKPYKILNSLQVELASKIMSVEVQVIDKNYIITFYWASHRFMPWPLFFQPVLG